MPYTTSVAGTTITASPAMAWAQKACSRGVSLASRPR